MSSRLRFSLTHQFQETPVRRLNGITCWVIEDPESIYDFINTEVRKEWESDAKSEGRDPRENHGFILYSGGNGA